MTSSPTAGERRRPASPCRIARAVSVLAFFTLAAFALDPLQAADEPELPWRSSAQILALLEKSKIEYRIELPKADDGFLSQLREPPGDVTGRPQLIASGDTVDLTTWVCNDEAEALLSDAEVAFGNGDMEAAQNGYRNAVRSDADCYIAHSHLGDTFLRTDNETMALAHYSRAIELNPIDHKTYAYRGHAHLRNGDADLALADFQQALALRPHYWLVEALLENYPGAPLQMADARLLAPIRLTRTGRRVIEVEIFDDSPPWIAYGLCAAAWQGEGLAPLSEEGALAKRELRKSRRTRAKERDEEGARFELELERECMAIALQVYVDGRDSVEGSESGEDSRPFTADPAFEALERAVQSGFFDEALLYGVASQRFAQAMLLIGETARERMLDFVEELILTVR
ncbi:MAG: tetratricopeptide repeat protein [Acidobacteriota bacterium]